jgi:GT2 family glycosyltransferase/glycosyltransferase involved in cell wall biosynthesis
MRQDDANNLIHVEEEHWDVASAETLRYLWDPRLDPLFWRMTRTGAASAWFEHIPFAHWLVQVASPRTFVELGTHAGVSYSAFCESVLRSNLATQCFAVDTWKGDEQASYYGEGIFLDFERFHSARYASFSELLRCTFDEALGYFAEHSVDLLHVDGYHTYEAVRHDFESWCGKLSEQAVVLFHDTNTRERDFGVWKYFAELKAEYPSFEFTHGHGLGLVAVGPRAPTEILALCKLDDPRKISAVRNRFARIGERWSTLWRADGAEAHALGLEKVRSDQEQHFKEIHRQSQQREADAARQIAERQAQLVDVEQRLRQAQSRITELDEIQRRSQEREAEAARQIGDLTQNVTDLKQNVAYLKSAAEREGAIARELHEKLSASERNAEQFRNDYTNALRSRSWKITAPLRSVNSHLKVARRRLLRRSNAEARLLQACDFFQADWYLQNYPDVEAAGVNPALHYLKDGWREGRDPSPLFRTNWYLDQHADVRQAGINPLLHYIQHGLEEGRMPSPAAATAPRPVTASDVDQQSQVEDMVGIDLAKVPERAGSYPPNEAPRRERPRPVKSQPRLWHFIGDSIDWLNAHQQLTGVGKVSSELFLASLECAASQRPTPCIFGKNTSELIAAPGSQEYEGFLRKIGALSQNGSLNPAPWSLTTGRDSPEPGDHVFFTGLVWTPTFTNLFKHLAQANIEFSVLVFDIIPIESPELVGRAAHKSFSEWLATTVNTASAIFVSSHLVKDQVLRWALLSGLEVKAEVIVVSFGLRNIDDALSRGDLARDPLTAKVDLEGFVLSVGTIDQRKNQILLCNIWNKLAQTIDLGKLPQLVLAGRDDLKVAQGAEEFFELVAAGKILILEGLSDRHLAGLYKACLFTAFPSLSEGYGLPVAESLQYGKLCLSSRLPVVQEHARDLVWYFSPDNLEDAVDLFSRAIQGPEMRIAAEMRISQEFCPPRWTETYETMAAAAERTLRSPIVDTAAGHHRPRYAGAKEVDTIGALSKAARWCRAEDPDVSILIINWNAALLTLECIRQIFAQTDGYTYEIVLADNGSAPADVRKLRSLGGGIRLLELGCNRFFGEANNIAAEEARGRYVCLLNNDVFVQPGWLKALVQAMEENPDVGATGPMFLFPDGVVQEAGASVDAGGYPVRFGRGEKQASSNLSTPRFVDYISAATLLLGRDLFLEAGGFDLAYEPAYYEDADLCLKIQALGRKVLYCPDAMVIHIEGHSANDNAVAEARRKALGDLNRDKFVSRWGEYLRSRDEGALTSLRPHILPPERRPAELPSSKVQPTQTAVVYTPFRLTPGGGESYLLTAAAILATRYSVWIVTPHRYSSLRLRNLGRELKIDLSALHLITEEEFLKTDCPDLMVTIGNHILPSTEGRGKVNIYLCQFPFPMDIACIDAQRSLLNNYGTILVYSDYARAHVYTGFSAHHLPPKPIAVVHPPVQQIAGDATSKKDMILSVGRFFVGGHSKRHDVLIETFKSIAFRFDRPVEFHLAGSSTPEPQHMDYLAQLMASARDFPIQFHVNPSAEQLHQLYRDAATYWHGTGIGADLVASPEKAEHFGISLVEAMSAQAVPFSLNSGGPREIIAHGETGYLYDTPDELAKLTLDLFDTASSERRVILGRAAARRAAEFSRENFSRRINDLVDDVA